MTKLSPRSEALAFRIWAYCQGVEWNCTVREIADALEASVHSVSSVIGFKSWHDRLRTPESDPKGERFARARIYAQPKDNRFFNNSMSAVALRDVFISAGVPPLWEARPE